MKVSVVPNPQVLDLADSYYVASEILATSDGNAIPIVNLRCHAIELFLKSLHLRDTAINARNGALLLRPESGRDVQHNLRESFDKALPEHQNELLSDMNSLKDDLEALKAVFRKSRYIYESGDYLPICMSARVSRYLAEKVPKLTRRPIVGQEAT